MKRLTSGSGYAPMNPVTASPSLKAITVGMLCTPNAEAVIWFASVSSFARRKAPARSSRDLLEGRRQLPARTAPFGPHVDDDRTLLRALDDDLLEGLVGDLDDVG